MLHNIMQYGIMIIFAMRKLTKDSFYNKITVVTMCVYENMPRKWDITVCEILQVADDGYIYRVTNMTI